MKKKYDLLNPEPEFTEEFTLENWLKRRDRIPPLYRTHDNLKLPVRAFRELESIEGLMEGGDPTGWIIAGETGSGKTRLACLIALHWCARTKGWPFFLTASNLRARAFADWDGAEKIIKEASKPGILIIDDLGKGAPVAGIDEIVFTILDQRVNWLKPTIITTQYPREQLRGRFKEPLTADGILRRINEFSAPVLL